MMKFPFSFPLDKPVEKAKIVARLDVMKLNGWQDLEGMTIDELNDLKAKAESAVLDTKEYSFVPDKDEHNKTIYEAREAIKDQIFKIQKQEYDRREQQAKRYSLIAGAAEHIRQAVDLAEMAYGIERDPSYYLNIVPSPMDEIDTSEMTETELNGAIREYDEEMYSVMAPDHALFTMLKTPAAAAFAKELKELNEVQQQRREMAMANRMTARKALDQLKAETAKTAVRNEVIKSNIDEVIAGLQERIEELESR